MKVYISNIIYMRNNLQGTKFEVLNLAAYDMSKSKLKHLNIDKNRKMQLPVKLFPNTQPSATIINVYK